MATKILRGKVWEFTVRRKNLLPKPLYLRFPTEQEGDDYVARLEQLLDRGIVPPEFLEKSLQTYKTLSEVIDAYTRTVVLSPSDTALLSQTSSKLGGMRMSEVTYQWADSWVAHMKRIEKLAPGTIRHHVGALARCLDWIARMQPSVLPGSNPLRLLPKRYASYTDADFKAAGIARSDISRERRLQPGEELRIRNILSGAKPDGKERPLALNHKLALATLFDLALETGMRMREMFTLELAQVDFAKRTIFLDKTKNGDKRQVPLSSVAERVLRQYLMKLQEEGLDERAYNGRLFPWVQDELTLKNLEKATSMLSQQFARIFSAAGCAGLHFHDLRHEATSRFFERTTMNVLEISHITGHKDPRMLKRYANLRGCDLAAKLW